MVYVQTGKLVHQCNYCRIAQLNHYKLPWILFIFSLSVSWLLLNECVMLVCAVKVKFNGDIWANVCNRCYEKH